MMKNKFYMIIAGTALVLTAIIV